MTVKQEYVQTVEQEQARAQVPNLLLGYTNWNNGNIIFFFFFNDFYVLQYNFHKCGNLVK